MTHFEGIHCAIGVDQPAPGVLLVTLEGHDIGELGDAPFRELEKAFAPEPGSLQLFIDARRGRTASVEVSGEWARWLGRHRQQFRHVSMLTGSRFIEMSATVVRRMAELGDAMRLYSDPAAFDAAFTLAIASTRPPRRFETSNSVITMEQPARTVLLLTFDGHDVGEHGDTVFKALESELPGSPPMQLFIDARNARAASIDVSGAWAKWLGAHRSSFRHVSMLTGSRFIQLSAAFVRDFAELGETMRLYSDAAAFEQALAACIATAPSSVPSTNG